MAQKQLSASYFNELQFLCVTFCFDIVWSLFYLPFMQESYDLN